mmetsp:Transcript_28160/g.61669  ORF Transcript_28160/g.61669 Transcript_28160/m.61669 type:complete len:345 (-) Transcript_28160:1455-2489(-)
MSASSGRLGERTFLLTGYLRKRNTKQSSVLLRNWDKRWFALDEQAFIYANSHKDTSPRQAFRIDEILGLELIDDLPEQRQKHYDFEITLPGRTLRLRPKSESQRRHWVAALNRVRSLCRANRASTFEKAASGEMLNSLSKPRHQSSFQGVNVYEPSGLDEFRAECDRRSKSSLGASTATTARTGNITSQSGLAEDLRPPRSAQEPDNKLRAECTQRQTRLARDLRPPKEALTCDKVLGQAQEDLSFYQHPSLRFVPTLSANPVPLCPEGRRTLPTPQIHRHSERLTGASEWSEKQVPNIRRFVSTITGPVETGSKGAEFPDVPKRETEGSISDDWSNWDSDDED